MGSVIWKYPLIKGKEQQQVGEPIEIEAPTRFEPLAVRWQAEGPCLWARVDPDSPMITMRFRIYGTGHKLDDPPGSYMGTVFTPYGGLVFHIYKVA